MLLSDPADRILSHLPVFKLILLYLSCMYVTRLSHNQPVWVLCSVINEYVHYDRDSLLTCRYQLAPVNTRGQN